jgi:hypothetical protein
MNPILDRPGAAVGRWRTLLRSIAVFGAVCSLLAGVAACSLLPRTPPVPTRGQIVGQWKHDASRTTIDFFASGKVVFTDVPAVLLYGEARGQTAHPSSLKAVTTESGSWETPRDSGSAFPQMTYDLTSGGYTLSIDGYTDSTRVVEFLYGDDVQFSYTFHRVSKSP